MIDNPDTVSTVYIQTGNEGRDPLLAPILADAVFLMNEGEEQYELIGTLRRNYHGLRAGTKVAFEDVAPTDLFLENDLWWVRM